jgi:hypothetical protein
VTGEDDAERMRRACIEAALQAWEDAGVSGLCAEGRFEAAIDAMRRVPPPSDPAPDDDHR